MSELVSPSDALKQVADAIPADCRHNIIVVGSLAAGYHYFRNDPKLQVRTKDADCLLRPRVEAIAAGVAVTEQLFAADWEFHPTEEFPSPGNASTPDEKLPVARLHPRGSPDWFIELLTVPESENDLEKRYVRLRTSHGDFSLCSFGFLSLAEYQPTQTEFGIAVARPEMMALANLLHHPTIAAERMSGLINGRAIKRSNKDLGRVLALAYLAENATPDSLLNWAGLWKDALKDRFPSHWRELAARVDLGLRQLLRPENEPDLDEARHTCEFGLLASSPLTLKLLEVTGRRLLQDAIEPLQKLLDTET